MADNNKNGLMAAIADDASIEQMDDLIAYMQRRRTEKVISKNTLTRSTTGTYVMSDEFDSGYVGSVEEEIAARVADGTYPTGR